jgi:hypothetical protein
MRTEEEEVIMQEIENPDEVVVQLTETPDEQYDIMSWLYHALKGSAVCAEYLADAHAAKDEDLASFFEKVLKENRKHIQHAKKLLAERLSKTPKAI